MTTINNDKKIIYTGIFLWLSSLSIILYLGQLELSLRGLLFAQLPLAFLLPYAILVAPFLEELLFRLIVIRDKSKMALMTAILCYLTLPLVYSKFYLYPFSIAVVIIALFSKSNAFLSNYKSTSLIVTTAICFSLAHLETFVLHSIVEFTLYLGLGLVLGV